MSSSKFFYKLKSIALVSSSAFLLGSGYFYYNNNDRFFTNFFMPAIRLLDPEQAHELGILACKYKLLPRSEFEDTEPLASKVKSIILKNPVGISAGFDKNAEAVEGLSSLGFGFVEVGSITPVPQPGNHKPRVFRLEEDEAIINRYGFNSDGHEKVFERLWQLRTEGNFKGVVGVNLGKNKTTTDSISDYVEGIKKFAKVADYLVINVSSPNTPGLRQMQEKDQLKILLTEVVKTNKGTEAPKPIFLKLSPDLNEAELKDVCSIISKKGCKIDGLIIANTTTERSEDLKSEFKNEEGGLSGAPLKDKTTKMIRHVFELTKGQVPIIGAGGIVTGEDALEKILAGASAVQIYSSFVYHGPPIVEKIKKELNVKLHEQGYANVSEAVGKGVNLKKSWFF